MASRIDKIRLYFRNIYLDYFEVFKETREGAKRRPIKASLYGASTIFVLNLFRSNEGLDSYRSEVTSACNRVGSVTERCRNPRSYQYVQNMGEINCHGLLRQVDLGFSTVIYKADTNPETALYKYHCSHLRPTLKEFFGERLVDVGFLGHWLNLELEMRDYDINEKEYDNLPA